MNNVLEALIWIVAGISYLTVGLFWTRYLYGYFRAGVIDGNMERYPHSMKSVADAIKAFEADRLSIVAFSAFLGLCWPISLPITGSFQFLSTFLDTTKILSRAEEKAEREAMTSRIKDMERELGIRE